MNFVQQILKNVRLSYREELAFFKSFHTNKVNWLIHALTIPLEWTATLLLLSLVKLHWVVAFATGLYHLSVGSRISLSAAVAQLVFCSMAARINERVGFNWSMLIAAAVHVLSWAVQVLVGHHIFEKNSPAMATKLTLNSVVLSVLLAWDSY